MKTSTMTKGEIAGWIAAGLLALFIMTLGWGTVYLTRDIPPAGICDLVSCR